MGERVVAWLGAGVLAAGVCTAALAGAAVAAADEDSGATAGTSQSSAADGSGDAATPRAADRVSAKPPTRSRSADTAPDADASDDAEAGAVADTKRNNGSRANEDAGDEVTGDEVTGEVTAEDADEEPLTEQPAAAVDRDEVVTDPTAQRDTGVAASEWEYRLAAATLAVAAAAEQATPKPNLLNVVGSFFWGLFDAVTKIIDAPPAVPPGSTLTAGRSRLEIDCGDGYTADADWYFPTDGEPERFIYFQHGFPARAGFYNVTLQQLAERNNAIVVAPSITSNIFACDACAASGEPMHAAVARLFEGDRAALLASARAAGFTGALPDQFVFTGQSAGASLAVAAGGYYYQYAADDEKSDMVGALLYEVSAIGGAKEGNALTNALRRLPSSVPVLNIAAEPNMLNSKGSANPVFLEERPGQFNGLQLVGGAHSDAFQSNTLFGIPQFIVNIAFGSSKPVNVEAVHVLTTGWLTPMYAGRVFDAQTRTGIYGVPGAPGEVLVGIPTVKGPAQGYVLPARTPQRSVFDRVIDAVFGLINVNLFARCVPQSTESAFAERGSACPTDPR